MLTEMLEVRACPARGEFRHRDNHNELWLSTDS